jgi:rod shape determining protein RodA
MCAFDCCIDSRGIAGGSQRWIVIGPLRGQPGEFAKITTAIIVARYFYLNRQLQAYKLRDLWPVMLMVGAIFALIFPEPDFGTAGFCILIAVAQILFIRLDLRSIAIVSICSIAAGLVGWFFLLKEYQKLRVLNFLNPELDPTGSGYNALQSLVAIGSGGITGKGFMQGTQTSLQFLPTRHTDFIFSVFAEQHGFWGCSILFLLYGTLTYIALEIARQTKDVFNSILAIGLAAIMFIGFTINIAMVLGIFPVVGLPLPFLSYGGSALLSVCVIMGILVSIDRANISRSKKPISIERAAVK